MDTRLNRTRKTVPQPAGKEPTAEDVAQTIEIDGTPCSLVDIRATGDVLLDVTFENRKCTRRLTPGPNGTKRLMPVVKPSKPVNSRVLYRVRLDTLKKTSKYFELLLGSDNFEEGNNISTTFAALKSKGVNPTESEPTLLPRISISDEDDSTYIEGREAVFGDLLRILHGADALTKFTIPYLAVLAVMADRFDCTSTVGSYFWRRGKVPWPQTYGVITYATEETLRQKVLISWLLEDKPRLASATKELIFRGSLRWSGDLAKEDYRATWWDLQDGLEEELHLRRSLILNTLSSLQTHFLHLYASRERQCKFFYDSSAACDSFQLGEMVKFFSSKNLLSFQTPLCAYEQEPDMYAGDIETLITIVRQCPGYQIDSHHAHCGLRTRLIPALDYIQSMLGSGVGIDRAAWKSDRPNHSWNVAGPKPFAFKKSLHADPRLKLDNYVTTSGQTKSLFTASRWDWTLES